MKMNARQYNDMYNEGGEGYNPCQREARQVESSATKQDQISEIYRKIARECGSVASECKNTDKKKAAYYEQIKQIEAEIEKGFIEEWTLSVTQKRRQEWKAFVMSVVNKDGMVDKNGMDKIHSHTREQGWGLEEVKKAVQMHGMT